MGTGYSMQMGYPEDGIYHGSYGNPYASTRPLTMADYLLQAQAPKSEMDDLADLLSSLSARFQFHQHLDELLFFTKVLCAAFLYLQFAFVFFWQKDIVKKLLVKCW